MRRITVLICLTLSVSACAGISKQACADLDWRTLGFQDGAHGAPAATPADSRMACRGQPGGGPDMAAYFAGWREGAQEFCTPANGFAAGMRGSNEESVCAGIVAEDASRDPFFTAYKKGRRLFELETAAVSAEQRVGETQSDIWAIRHRLAEVDRALAEFGVSGEERADLLAEREALLEERASKEQAVDALIQERRRALDALAAYRESLPQLAGGAVRPSNASF